MFKFEGHVYLNCDKLKSCQIMIKYNQTFYKQIRELCKWSDICLDSKYSIICFWSYFYFIIYQCLFALKRYPCSFALKIFHCLYALQKFHWFLALFVYFVNTSLFIYIANILLFVRIVCLRCKNATDVYWHFKYSIFCLHRLLAL